MDLERNKIRHIWYIYECVETGASWLARSALFSMLFLAQSDISCNHYLSNLHASLHRQDNWHGVPAPLHAFTSCLHAAREGGCVLELDWMHTAILSLPRCCVAGTSLARLCRWTLMETGFLSFILCDLLFIKIKLCVRKHNLYVQLLLNKLFVFHQCVSVFVLHSLPDQFGSLC